MHKSGPVLRASYAKTIIATIKQCSPGERDALLSQLDPALRTSIREASFMDWMDAQAFARLPNLVFDVLGAERAKAFWRANLRGSLERTLLSPLRLGAIALYGESPGSLLRMTPQAWQLVSRGCGICHTVDQKTGFELHFEQLPPELTSPAMLQLWSGGSESCIERMKFEGHAEGELADQAGTAVIRVQWLERSKG